jgi:hypothetical protein
MLPESIEERAAVQARLIEYAFQHEQYGLEQFARWALHELGFTPEETPVAWAFAEKALLFVQEYRQRREQARAALRPQRQAPSKERLLIVPAGGTRRFLCDEQFVLHSTALVGSVPGPGNLATLYEYQEPFLCHEDQNCIQMVGETFRDKKPTPIRLTGNEGYAPCGGCGLPVAGPSFSESFAHPPLPVPEDIADMLYGEEQWPQFRAPAKPKQTRKRARVEGQLSLFSE